MLINNTYFIRANVIEEIISKERPDGVLVSMGGQTALNVGIELWKAGVFEKYNCKVSLLITTTTYIV